MQKTINTRSGRTIILPTLEEDAQINAGILDDPDTFEPTDEQFALFKSFKDSTFQQDDQTQPITLSLSPRVLSAFQAMGAEWQTHIDKALNQWLDEHPPTASL